MTTATNNPTLEERVARLEVQYAATKNNFAAAASNLREQLHDLEKESIRLALK